MNRIREFVERWYGRPFVASDGISRCALESRVDSSVCGRLPPVVLDWYELAGVRFGMLAGHIDLLSPEMLEVSSGFLCIYNDPNAGLLWGLREAELARSNPPVVLDTALEKNAYPCFTEFLYALVLHDRLSADEGCVASPPIPRQLVYGDGIRDAISRALPFIPVKPIVDYPVPAGNSVDLFGDSETLAVTVGLNWATLTARTPDAWEVVEDFIRRNGHAGDPYALADWLHGA